ncbi:uncharacterized protein APUU_21889S [Aspergillus puulaauensis]|uniref:Uncharacterized protein n=1 Tax=Aspergillus puulaauensis TaxID=1220207 RepID=A0A7R7XH50_9EURO|nr:uncharacterized protein APUU_21889S [Aspergillus puulaauensis]BCS21457.1 hypothetical protein APUU_21889S [Aspergillus puulaauensis]
MTSIQRVAASAVQLNPEANFSLFHANFDFSLFKCEAPAELLPLGESLSRQRRELAEEGSFHILARRLGILFEKVLPEVPSLLKAYGSRASEIASELDRAGAPSKSIADGIFGPHLGLDTTTIWAGATSGSCALLMHLLACMLARIWSPQEATAIWAELVDERRQEIKNQAMESDKASNFFAQQAALYETDWSNLQAWDASARAWLQVADNSSVKQQQKRVELIANNLSVAIQTQVTPDGMTISAPGRKMVYGSVLHNFRAALFALDNLVSGQPQRILDGGVLLGLTSWHLYPDLVILGPKTKDVFQKDLLIAPCGVATLSIAYDEDPNGNQDGVYWSLPLSSLRYYGTVQRKRSSLRDSKKLSFPEFQALILGASLDSLDGLSAAADILKCIWEFSFSVYQDILQKMQRAPARLDWTVKSQITNMDTGKPMWEMPKEEIRDLGTVMDHLHLLSPLMGGIELYLSRAEEERAKALQLIRYGANSAASWIGNKRHSSDPPFFGVADLAFILGAIQTPGDRVQVLQRIWQLHGSPSEGCIIRFRREDSTWGYTWLSSTKSATSGKRSRREYESGVCETDSVRIPDDEDWAFVSSKLDGPQFGSVSGDYYSCDLPESINGELHGYRFGNFIRDEPMEATPIVWDLVLGNHGLAGVYTRHDRPPIARESIPRSTVPLPVLRELVNHGCLDLVTVMEGIKGFLATHRPDHHFSLLALGRVIEHYKRELPHITVPMSVIKQSPWTWSWAKLVVTELKSQRRTAASLTRDGIITDKIYPSPLTRQQAFALILQFESGTLSAEVNEMDKVMAISSGNSLFIAQRVLSDPIPPDNMASCAVAHALGNVGKPGIALLFAPEQPLVREHDVERWQIVNHNLFDGSQAGGVFDGSSLHMSFTGWEGPLRVRGPSAFRGMEAYNLETRISMYDRAEWVADLNILESLTSSPNLKVCGVYGRQCDHDPSIAASGAELVSIDCWEELLSTADRPMVLRSGSSWMVRLTGVSIAYSRGFKCFLLPAHKEFCWTCVVEEADTGQREDQKLLFVY